MLGIDRRAARSAWTAALVLLVLWLAYLLRTTFFVFTLAVLFAYLLSPLVDFLDRFLPSRTRTPALGLAYVLVLGAVIGAGAGVGSRVAAEARQLRTDLPANFEKWRAAAPGPQSGVVDRYKSKIVDAVQSEIGARSGGLLDSLPRAGAQMLNAASNLVYVVIIPVLAFFFLQDGHLIRLQVLALAPEGPRRALLDDVMAGLDSLLAHYMRALLVLSTVAFTAYGLALSILGVPYGILLAAGGAVLEVIPMLGPLTACVIIGLVAIFTGSHPLLVVPFLVLFRMFQDYFLSPKVMGRGVELHPLVVLFGVFAGAELAGVPGSFLSVPVLALIRILYLRIRKQRLAAPSAPAMIK